MSPSCPLSNHTSNGPTEPRTRSCCNPISPGEDSYGRWVLSSLATDSLAKSMINVQDWLSTVKCLQSGFCLFIFNWRIIALQNLVGFCQTPTWISHRYTYVPSSWTSLPSPFPSHPSRLLQSPCLSYLCNLVFKGSSKSKYLESITWGSPLTYKVVSDAGYGGEKANSFLLSGQGA